MPPALGASIALFMLLAATVTPEAPAGGVGLRARLAARASAPALLTRPAAARERSALASCDGRLDREGRPGQGRQIELGAAGACSEQVGASSADAAPRHAE
jgi:hypothetical protein